MGLSVCIITFAISITKSPCFLLAPRSMNKTAIFLCNNLKVSSLFVPMLSYYVSSFFIYHMLTLFSKRFEDGLTHPHILES